MAKIIKYKKDDELPGGGVYKGFFVPKLFTLNDNGLIYFKENNKTKRDETGEMYSLVNLLPEPIYINCIFWDEENLCFKYEIIFFHKKKLKKVIVEVSKISSASTIVKSLSSYGIYINSNNAKCMVNFFTGFAKCNRYKFKDKLIVNTFGWYENSFLPYSDEYSLYISDKSGRDITSKMCKTMDSKGSLKKWVDYVYEQSSLSNDFRFVVSCSFASPLIKLLYRSFVVHNFAKSENGKTAAMNAALSVWGNPKDLLEDYRSTATYLEEKAKIYQNIVMAIDEKRDKNTKFSGSGMEDLLYTLANGKSKGKCDKNSNLMLSKTWNLIVLSSSEHRMTRSNFSEGSINRLLELELKPYYKQTEKASDSYNFFESNYGLVGKKYIRKLIEIGFEDINDLKRYVVSKLTNDENLTAHINAITVIVIADYISQRYIYGDKNFEINKSIDFGKIYLSKLPKKDDIDTSKQALNYLIQSIAANYFRFQNEDIGNYERWGYKDTKGNICIYKNRVSDLLESEGFYSSTVLNDFREKDYTICDNKRFDRLVRIPNDINIGKKRERMIVIKKEVYSSLTNDEEQNVTDELHTSNINFIREYSMMSEKQLINTISQAFNVLESKRKIKIVNSFYDDLISKISEQEFADKNLYVNSLKFFALKNDEEFKKLYIKRLNSRDKGSLADELDILIDVLDEKIQLSGNN